jgi:hypothetical protein
LKANAPENFVLRLKEMHVSLWRLRVASDFAGLHNLPLSVAQHIIVRCLSASYKKGVVAPRWIQEKS